MPDREEDVMMEPTDEEVSRFARIVIGKNPNDAEAKIWGFCRRPYESDDELLRRLDASRRANGG